MTATPERSNSDPLFSQPEVVGARHADSVLFNVQELEAVARTQNDAQESGKGGSGLIDVKRLVGEVDAAVVEPAATVVEEVKVTAPPQQEAPAAAPNKLMMGMIAVLLVAIVVLGIAALKLG